MFLYLVALFKKARTISVSRQLPLPKELFSLLIHQFPQLPKELFCIPRSITASDRAFTVSEQDLS